MSSKSNHQRMRDAIKKHKGPPPPPPKPRPPAPAPPAEPTGPVPRNPKVADGEMRQFPRYPDGTFFVAGWQGGKWRMTLRVPYPQPDGRTGFKELTGEDDRFHRAAAQLYREWLAYDRSLRTAAPSACPPVPS